jgi:hypothetical protein
MDARPCCPHDIGRHLVRLGVEVEGRQQVARAQRVRRVVARRRVGGHANQFLQEAHLFVEVGVDVASIAW